MVLKEEILVQQVVVMTDAAVVQVVMTDAVVAEETAEDNNF